MDWIWPTYMYSSIASTARLEVSRRLTRRSVLSRKPLLNMRLKMGLPTHSASRCAGITVFSTCVFSITFSMLMITLRMRMLSMLMITLSMRMLTFGVPMITP
eukprot:1184725-Prorocentrum_minimum.AAC.1